MREKWQTTLDSQDVSEKLDKTQVALVTNKVVEIGKSETDYANDQFEAESGQDGEQLLDESFEQVIKAHSGEQTSKSPIRSMVIARGRLQREIDDQEATKLRFTQPNLDLPLDLAYKEIKADSVQDIFVDFGEPAKKAEVSKQPL